MHSTRYHIRVEASRGHGTTHAQLDGAGIDCNDGRVRVPLDGKSHSLVISLRTAVHEDVDSGEQVA
jgi:cyclic beta-1,2-glucan synthetase